MTNPPVLPGQEAARAVRRVYATATLRHLALRRRLRVRDLVPGEAKGRVADFLRSLLSRPEGIDPDSCPLGWFSQLERQFLVIESESPVPRPGSAFAFVTAINFELTYGCNLACQHCLQGALRPIGKTPWLNPDLVSQALADASWLGLMNTGVNFTGGEVCVPDSPILDFITQAARLGIPVRCNTNAWWGGRTGFTVGKTSFDSDAELVNHLHAIGLKTLAMSLDNRYVHYPELLNRMLSVAARCEDAGLPYEFVSVDGAPELVRSALAGLSKKIDGDPKHLSARRPNRPRGSDLVDIGSAAGPSGVVLQPVHLAVLTTRSPCQRRGFYRPHYLHVNPDGGVRSCLYSPGASVLGHLDHERLPEILNRADRNDVVRLFSEGAIDDFVTKNLAPWRHLYRSVVHPCAVSALIARVSECLSRAAEKVGRDLTDDEKKTAHVTIAREWNLSATASPAESSGSGG